MAEPLKFPTIEPGGFGAPASSTTGVPSYDFLRGLGASTLSGATELVGIEIPGASKFRQDHPFLGFASQFASAAIPYTGWFKATKAIKGFDAAVRSIGNLEKSPILTGAAREAARFAPFEVGRLGVSQVVGDAPFSDMATDTALSLGLAGGIGGLLHGLASAGTRNARTIIPGVDISAPPPMQLRKMKEIVAGGTLTPEQTAAANMRIREFDVLSRGERLGNNKREKYVFGVGGEGLTRGLNSLFNIGGKTTTVVDKRPFIKRTKPDTPGFASEAEWKAAAQAAGLPENFPELGRYFRQVTFRPTGRTDAVAGRTVELFNDLQLGKITAEDYSNTISRLASKDYATSRAKAIDRQITSGLDSAGDGWFLKREEPDGLFVMARKTAGVPGTGHSSDSWVVFKTDKPGAFIPANQRWANVILEGNSWHKTAAELTDGGRIYNGVRAWQKHFPLQNVEVLRNNRLAALVPKRLQGKSNEFAQRLVAGAREFIAPTAYQFKNSRLGNYIFQSARVAYESADNLAHETVYGRQAVSGKNLFLQALREGTTEPTSDSFKAILDPLDNAGLEQLQRLWRDSVDPAEYQSLVQAGEISQLVADTAHRLDQLEGLTWAEFQRLAEALGETPAKARKGHLGISRHWEGDTRIALRDATGALRAVAAGANRRAAQKNAKAMLEKWPDLKKAEELSISQTASLPKDLSITAGTPGFMQERVGVRGFKWDLEPWTKNELLDAYHASQQARMRYMADKTVDDLLTKPLAQLASLDPTTHRIVTSRIRDLQGKQSEFGAWQNKQADLLLAPILGVNSATKIVSATNTAMFTWHLGMGNIAFPILNALTFVQTVVPEAAMIMKAADQDLSYYTFFAAGGTKGPMGGMGMLSPMKLMGKSLREMAKPREGLLKSFARASNEGVIAPRLVEDYIGETGEKAVSLRKAFSSGRGFVDWVQALSSWLPANSEKLARTQAFTTGYLLAKDVFRIADEDAAYRLARQFTEKTMFLYSTADRPRIFTTPTGSALGLFKTWMMNYMAAMLEYSGQAVKGNIAPLAWQTAGTAALGGLAATPLYWIADGFSKAFSNDSLLQNTYNLMNEDAADAFMFGMPAALTGISLYSQVTSPFSNPARDASMLWSAVTLDRAAALGKSVGFAFDHWSATGEHPGRSDKVRDAVVKALAPSTIARIVSAFSGEEMIRSLGSGYPVLKDVSLGDRIAYALKFNPTELDKAYQVSQELYEDQNKRRDQISALGTAFAEAQDERDSEQMRSILRQATVWGLDVSSVLKSAARRGKLARESAIEGRFKPQEVVKYRNVLGN